MNDPKVGTTFPKALPVKKFWQRRIARAFVVAGLAAIVAYLVLHKGGFSLKPAGSVPIDRQLRDPWKYLQADRSKAFGLLFASPVLTVQQIRMSGVRPSQEMFENNQRIWLFDFVGEKESTPRDHFRIRLVFEDNKLKRVDFPYSVGLLISDSAVIQYAFALGYSTIDYTRRQSVPDPNIMMPFPAVSMPNKTECMKIFSVPASSRKEAGVETLFYRFEQVLEPKSRALGIQASLSFSSILGAFQSGTVTIAGFSFVFTESDAHIQR